VTASVTRTVSIVQSNTIPTPDPFTSNMLGRLVDHHQETPCTSRPTSVVCPVVARPCNLVVAAAVYGMQGPAMRLTKIATAFTPCPATCNLAAQCHRDPPTQADHSLVPPVASRLTVSP
jgi:hypothetical protein